MRLFLSERFEQALVFAFRLHRHQARKGSGVPYVTHLMSVASLVLEYGGGEDEAIAALLHDAVEDQGGNLTLSKIRSQFGNEVAELVSGCSDSHALFKPPWRMRKEQYLQHLQEVPASTRLVSACDKLHNLRTILSDYRQLGDSVWTRFKGGKEGTLWYYREMVAEFSLRGPQQVAEELARTLAELDRLVETSE